MKPVRYFRDVVPATIQDFIIVLATDQLETFVKPRWAVICFQKCCVLCFQPGVRFLINGAATIVREAQADIWIASCAKQGSRFGKKEIKRIISTAKESVIVQRLIRAMTNIQFNHDRSEAFHEIGSHEVWWDMSVESVSDWGELTIISSKEHLDIPMKRNLGNNIEQRTFCHEKLVQAKRALQSSSLLNFMLQPRESNSVIELSGGHVSTTTTCDKRPALVILREQLEAFSEEGGFSSPRSAEEDEIALFTSQGQSEFSDVFLPFAENLDVWHELRRADEVLLEEGTLLHCAHLAVSETKDRTLASTALDVNWPIPVETPRRLVHVLEGG